MSNPQKRSPLKNPSLRHAGQSIEERIYEVAYEKMLPYAVVTAVLIGMAATEWLRAYLKSPYQPWSATIVAIFAVVFCGIKINSRIKELNNLKLGRDGEKIVGEALENLRKNGYQIYHDIVDETFNIDHIIVGPAGAFTIETKTIRKNKGANPSVSYDGLKLVIDGFTPDRDPIRQAMAQKRWLEEFISNSAKIKIKVKPVVIYPGWFVNNINGDTDVWVLNEKALPTYLDNAPTQLNADQINLISSHIESFIRNI
jgi:hypothetical protein